MFISMEMPPVMGSRVILNGINRLDLAGDDGSGNGAKNGAEERSLNGLIMAGSDKSTGRRTDYGTIGDNAILIGCGLRERGCKQG